MGKSHFLVRFFLSLDLMDHRHGPCRPACVFCRACDRHGLHGHDREKRVRFLGTSCLQNVCLSVTPHHLDFPLPQWRHLCKVCVHMYGDDILQFVVCATVHVRYSTYPYLYVQYFLSRLSVRHTCRAQVCVRPPHFRRPWCSSMYSTVRSESVPRFNLVHLSGKEKRVYVSVLYM